jgi:hypothetical protein
MVVQCDLLQQGVEVRDQHCRVIHASHTLCIPLSNSKPDNRLRCGRWDFQRALTMSRWKGVNTCVTAMGDARVQSASSHTEHNALTTEVIRHTTPAW